MRASRALPTGGAIRVVTATLGPGLLAGDGVDARRRRRRGGDADRRRANGDPGLCRHRTVAQRRVGARRRRRGAVSRRVTVLLLAPGAHETSAELDVSGDGFALHAEIVVLGAARGCARARSARIDGRLVVRDACDLDGDGSERALLTAIVVSADDERQASLATAFGELFAREPAVRGGLGATDGATILRAQADGAWPLQRLLERIVAVARMHEAERPRALPHLQPA
jgi:hypothetical protein